MVVGSDFFLQSLTRLIGRSCNIHLNLLSSPSPSHSHYLPDSTRCFSPDPLPLTHLALKLFSMKDSQYFKIVNWIMRFLCLSPSSGSPPPVERVCCEAPHGLPVTSSLITPALAHSQPSAYSWSMPNFLPASGPSHSTWDPHFAGPHVVG